MVADPATPGLAHRIGSAGLVLLVVWLGCAFWNVVKPLPAGIHVASLPARLAAGQVDFVDDQRRHGSVQQRELALIDRAEQLIVLEVCPLSNPLLEHLLSRKHQRPNLTVVLVTDPRRQIYGGTPARTLSALETAGIIVARVRLERLRDDNPLYSGFWRLSMGWWSEPFDEPAALSAMRQRNAKADHRQLLAADDGAGGWIGIVNSTPAVNAALMFHGRLATDLIAGELEIARWSTDDERLPSTPAVSDPGVGTIDVRLITEGAIDAALREAIGATGSGDSIRIVAHQIGDRAVIHTLLVAAVRGAIVELLLDPNQPANQAVAAEFRHAAPQACDIRWQAHQAEPLARFVLIQHRNDVWLDFGSADLRRRSFDDSNLEANVELQMPAGAAPARAAGAYFARQFAASTAYAVHADESRGVYWRYRIEEAAGL